MIVLSVFLSQCANHLLLVEQTLQSWSRILWAHFLLLHQ